MASTPFLRPFMIDGQEQTDTTHRVHIVDYFTPIEGQTFIDLGSGDACESRAIAHRGAKRAVAVEGKTSMFGLAKEAQDYLKLPNHEVLQYDVRKIDTYGLEKFDVVTCFGMLYHMTNPFNVLKRIKNLTGGLLLLETHIAPRYLNGLNEKILSNLSFDMDQVTLDGIPFEGKLVPHFTDPKQHKGPLDGNWTFWLTLDALLKAVIRAGFAIQDFHYDLDETDPEPVQKWGKELGFGHANAKVWIVATPQEETVTPVAPPSEQILTGTPFWVDSPRQLIKRLGWVDPNARAGWIKRSIKGWGRNMLGRPIKTTTASQPEEEAPVAVMAE